MAVELDEDRHPVVVLRTGEIAGDADVDALFAAFERLFEIGPVGLVIDWGRVARDARARIGEFRATNDERFVAAVRCTVSVVAAATVDTNRAEADPHRAGRAWYASTESEAVDWVVAQLAPGG
ncbi:MAG: hypothetical protein AAGA99_02940 [Actinomycetota bacterium]